MFRYLRAVYGRAFSSTQRYIHGQTFHAGKITLYAVCGSSLLVLLLFVTVFQTHVGRAYATDVSTSVTVLNTPPVWTVDAQESTESSTTTPTNAGYTISWTALGTDGNNDNYYLLICKTSAAATANSGAAPMCGGGISNQWAVSSVTTSGVQATAATTTKATFPFAAEKNDWYAFICDGNASLAQCNVLVKTGSGLTASPFVINHPPIFSVITNTSPVNPGSSITFSATATDTDVIRGGDTVKLYVCKGNSTFATSTCGAGGFWAISTFATNNPSTSTVISIPTQDTTYAAYVYVADNNNLVATSTLQGTNSPFAVSNVAPTVTAATVSLVDPNHAGNLQLTVPSATSGPYQIKFTVVDNNSCLNASSTQEDVSAIANVYRSGVTQASCQLSSDYNTNSCYPQASPLTTMSCTQDGGSCSGATSVSSTWTCVFNLWYTADATDVGSVFAAQNWLASVKVTDDQGATSTLTEAVTGNDLTSFLAFNVSQSSIAFGGLQPGQQNDPLATTTNLIATGNVGLDENLYGDTMCTTWTAADSCDAGGVNAGTKIPVTNQHVGTSSVAYANAFSYALTASTSPLSVGIHVLKTTSTSSPQVKSTYWGIGIPSSITLAGNYSGQDTIIATKSSSAFW